MATLNFNQSGANSLLFELPADVVVQSFTSDLGPDAGTAYGTFARGYINSDPVNPAGYSDDSITDQQILIADRECSGEILTRGKHYFHPNVGGEACLCQLRYTEFSAEIG